jgi:hypothetical protein
VSHDFPGRRAWAGNAVLRSKDRVRLSGSAGDGDSQAQALGSSGSQGAMGYVSGPPPSILRARTALVQRGISAGCRRRLEQGLDGLRIPVPNHREIAEGAARSIMRQAAAKLGEEWWT